jgi:predicted RNase H-like nuclease (RuvC/YqgF family)
MKQKKIQLGLNRKNATTTNKEKKMSIESVFFAQSVGHDVSVLAKSRPVQDWQNSDKRKCKTRIADHQRIYQVLAREAGVDVLGLLIRHNESLEAENEALRIENDELERYNKELDKEISKKMGSKAEIVSNTKQIKLLREFAASNGLEVSHE